MNPFSGGSRLGPATRGLLVSLVLIFIIQLACRNFLALELEPLLGFRPTMFLRGHIYQLLTYPFLHGSLTHLLFNALVLYSVGSTLEERWGTRSFLKYYSVCAIGGAMLQTVFWLGAMLFKPDAADALGAIPIIGASGALYGLFMAFGRLYGDAQVLVFFVFPMKAKHFVAVLAGIEIVSAVFSSDPGFGGGVAHRVAMLGNPRQAQGCKQAVVKNQCAAGRIGADGDVAEHGAIPAPRRRGPAARGAAPIRR